ncbi:MAG: hypothetical protein ABJI69_07780 [Balneola sp.]
MGVLVALFFFVLASLAFLFGFDQKGTFSTKYESIPDSNSQIIETDYFLIHTPDNWIHILHGHGDEGDPYGIFITGKGIISYEYGLFGPLYEKDDQIYEYEVEKEFFGRFTVNIATNQKNETGIAIPAQFEMSRHMTFYLGKSVSKNYDERICNRTS